MPTAIKNTASITHTVRAVPFITDPESHHINTEITTNPKAFINKMFLGSKYDFGMQNILSTGQYRLLGYNYDLRPLLKRYVYNQYGYWYTVYAPNKTLARKYTHGRLTTLVEIK